MGNVTRLALSGLWRALIIVPIIVLTLQFILNQTIDGEAVRYSMFMSFLMLFIFAFILAAGMSGDYARNRRKLSAYVSSLILSSTIGVSGVVSFLLIIIFGAGQAKTIPSLLDDLASAPNFLFISCAMGVGTAWLFTIVSWFGDGANGTGSDHA